MSCETLYRSKSKTKTQLSKEDINLLNCNILSLTSVHLLEFVFIFYCRLQCVFAAVSVQKIWQEFSTVKGTKWGVLLWQ